VDSPTRYQPHSSGDSRIHSGSPELRQPGAGNFDSLFDSWFLLGRRWRLIAIVTVIAFAWAFLMTKFVLTKWYQATALVRPSPPQSEANEMSSIASQVLGGGGLGSMLSGMGLDTQTQDEAEKDISIIQSYSFTMDLLDRHRLTPTIRSEESGILSFGEDITPWKLYEAMEARFDCNFDLETGNINLAFLAPSRAEARMVLDFYIDDLREKLRLREIRKAALAIESLKEQAAQTSDALLQQDLYSLLAKQVQKQQLAKVQADFAFTVIDPPVVPDKPYKPKVILSSAVAAALAFFGCIGAILLRQRISGSWQEYQRRVRAMPRPPEEVPVKKAEELSSVLPRKQSL
jgi:capsular polysaccharide biosynthesis protein